LLNRAATSICALDDFRPHTQPLALFFGFMYNFFC
jgi:hypothetical protein